MTPVFLLIAISHSLSCAILHPFLLHLLTPVPRGPFHLHSVILSLTSFLHSSSPASCCANSILQSLFMPCVPFCLTFPLHHVSCHPFFLTFPLLPCILPFLLSYTFPPSPRIMCQCISLRSGLGFSSSFMILSIWFYCFTASVLKRSKSFGKI